MEDPIITSGPGIGTYVDGVFAVRGSTSLLSASDIARQEVRRGPRGTMLGRNTVGGAINIVTQKPSFDFGGNASVKIGNYDMLETKLSVNVPLLPEKLAARFGFASAQRDGFSRNRFVGGGSTAGKDRVLAGRAQLLWNATETLEVLFSADASDEPRTAPASKCKFVGFGASKRGPTPGPLDNGRRAGVIATTSVLPAPKTREERDSLIQISKDAAASGGAFTRACKDDDRRDNFSVSADSPLDDTSHNLGATVTATWTPSGTLNLKSTSAYRSTSGRRLSDGDGTGLPISGSFRGGRVKTITDQISQEFVLSGLAFDSKLQWTAGAFGLTDYLRNTTRAKGFTNTANQPAFILSEGTNGEKNQLAALAAMAAAMNPQAQMMGMMPMNGMAPPMMAMAPAMPMMPPMMLPVDGFPLTTGVGECIRFAEDQASDIAVSCLRPFTALGSENVIKLSNANYGLYSEATLQMTDAFSVSAGLRYTSERKRVRRFGQLIDVKGFSQAMDVGKMPLGIDGNPDNGGRFVLPILLIPQVNGRFTNYEFVERYGGFTPRLTAQYRFADNITAYATFTSGFESGRFNGALITAVSPYTDSENSTEYEVGFRSRWWGGKLNLNAAAFTSRFTDVNRSVTGNDANGTLTTLTSNVGKVRINGGQVDLNVSPLPRLLLTSSVQIRDGRYLNFDVPPGTPSFKDARIPNLPAYVLDFGAVYSLPVGTIGDLRYRFSWRQESKKGTIVADPQFTRVGKHGVLGGRIALDFKDGATSLALFGSNLLDREFVAVNVDFSNSNGTLQQFYAPPRQFGLELTRKF